MLGGAGEVGLFGLGGTGWLSGGDRGRCRLLWGWQGQWVAGPHGTQLCFVHLVLRGVALHLGNSLVAAPVQSFAWHWVSGGGGSGTMERKSPRMS